MGILHHLRQEFIDGLKNFKRERDALSDDPCKDSSKTADTKISIDAMVDLIVGDVELWVRKSISRWVPRKLTDGQKATHFLPDNSRKVPREKLKSTIRHCFYL